MFTLSPFRFLDAAFEAQYWYGQTIRAKNMLDNAQSYINCLEGQTGLSQDAMASLSVRCGYYPGGEKP